MPFPLRSPLHSEPELKEETARSRSSGLVILMFRKRPEDVHLDSQPLDEGSVIGAVKAVLRSLYAGPF